MFEFYGLEQSTNENLYQDKAILLNSRFDGSILYYLTCEDC